MHHSVIGNGNDLSIRGEKKCTYKNYFYLQNFQTIKKSPRINILRLFNFLVTMEGFEPSRPYEHHPLKMASLPFLHMAKNEKRSSKINYSTFCDPTGARTQDPIIKSDVLYRLSYRVIAFKKFNLLITKFVTRLGLEPRTPSLKVMCSTD